MLKPGGMPTRGLGVIRLFIKKSMFPVKRVAKIKASRAAAFFFFSLFFLVGIYCPFLEKKEFLQKGKKKSLRSHLF